MFRIRIGIVLILSAFGCGCGGGDGDAVAVPEAAPPPALRQTGTFEASFAIRQWQSVYCLRGLDAIGYGSRPELPGILCIDDAASVSADGEPIDIADVADGSVATVSGKLLTDGVRVEGVVTSIDIQRTIVGTIEFVDVPRARFGVLGQRVYVSDITLLSGYDGIDGLAVGDRVTVSGYFSANGEVLATGITRSEDGSAFVVRGILKVSGSGMIEIADLGIGSVWDYSFEGFPAAGPADGDAVLVLGDDSGDQPVPHTIRFIGGEWKSGPEGIRHLTGIVTKRDGLSEVHVGGRRVDCEVFPCEVETRVQEGTLVAVARIPRLGPDDFRIDALLPTSDRIRVFGRVEQIDGDSRSLAVLGFPILVLPTAVLRDNDGPPMQLADVAIGDALTVVGGPMGDLLVAGRIDGRPEGEGSSTAHIWTRAHRYFEPRIHVLGREIMTDATTVVFDDCLGEMDLRWLFDEAARVADVQLRIELADATTEELIAKRIDLDTFACGYW